MYFVTMNKGTRRIERVEIEILRMRRFRLEKAGTKDRQWLRRKLDEVSEGYATCVEIENESLLLRPCAEARPSG